MHTENRCAEISPGQIFAEQIISWAAKLLRFLVRGFTATLLVATFFVTTQDFHIFPGLCTSLLFGASAIPAGVEALTAVASDGQRVTLWKVTANQKTPASAALLFHGNAETVADFLPVQMWLKSLDITSYSVEYRGYAGRRSGWPSEDGFYRDSEAAYQLLQTQEHSQPDRVIVLGSSIGTGTAAYVAQKYNVGALVLFSPYLSLTEAISETPTLGYLSPMLKYHFPTSDFIEKLSTTCVIVAHGRQDEMIPFRHAEGLQKHYKGLGTFALIASDTAGHDDIVRATHRQVADAIKKCMKPE